MKPDLNTLFPRDDYRKPYVVIDCPNFQKINQGLIDYAKKYTKLFTDNPHEPGFAERGGSVKYCNFVDLKHFIKENKEIFDFFKDKKAIISDVYYTLCWDHESVILPHVDKPPVTWKINWPVYNMEKTAVRFWKYRDPNIDLNSAIDRCGDPHSKDFDNYRLDESLMEVTYRHWFNGAPVAMNGLIPHDVELADDAEFPRIGIQIMFRDIPRNLIPHELL